MECSENPCTGHRSSSIPEPEQRIVQRLSESEAYSPRFGIRNPAFRTPGLRSEDQADYNFSPSSVGFLDRCRVSEVAMRFTGLTPDQASESAAGRTLQGNIRYMEIVELDHRTFHFISTELS